jgi:hypothetical protein
MSKQHPEEVVSVGSKEDERILKDLITGPDIRIKDKFLDEEIQAMASFVGELAHNHPALLRNWMRNNPDSDFVQWPRTFENTGG